MQPHPSIPLCCPPVTPISRDAISLPLVKGFQQNLSQRSPCELALPTRLSRKEVKCKSHSETICTFAADASFRRYVASRLAIKSVINYVTFYRAASNADAVGLAMRILSVSLSVKRVHCDKTEKRSLQIFIPY